MKSLFKVSSVQYLFVAENAPHRAIVVSDCSGNYQLHAVDFESGFHRQVTRKKGGAIFGSISKNGEYIYWLDDKDGEEHGHFVRVHFLGGRQKDITPQMKPYFSYSIHTSLDNEVMCFTVAEQTKNKVFGVHKKGNDYETFEIYSSNFSLSDVICSQDGKNACVVETDVKTNQSTYLLLSIADKKVIARFEFFDNGEPLAFSKDKNEPTALFHVKIRDWQRPVLYNFVKNRVLEIKHLDFKGDVWVTKWDEEDNEMILCDVYKAEQKKYKYNTKTKELIPIRPQTGIFNFHFNSTVCLKDKTLIFRWSDFNTSPRLIKIGAPYYKKWQEIKEWSGEISTKYKIENILVRSSGGEKVQMWVVRPKSTSKNIPFIIDIHGGPHGVNMDDFSPEAQAWLLKGFGFCTINYSGSISFGKKFEKKIFGNPGHFEVEDIVSARNWLVKNEYADQNNIILHGWSWGGYLTLLALGKYPKLWSGGVAGASVADCIMNYEDSPAYFKALDEGLFSGTPKTAREKYVKSSPVTYIQNIEASLFIIHGENDVRCPPRQIRHFASELEKLNKDFKLEWYKSGHVGDFTNTALRIKNMKMMVNFVVGIKK